MRDNTAVVAGNTYDKYHTRNPVARYLMNGFIRSFGQAFRLESGETVLEVGCGEGYLLHHMRQLYPAASMAGLDVSRDILRVAAREGCPAVPFLQASADALPWADASWDWVVACEVLEHLEHPEQALQEMQRVCRRGCLVSVPWEPYWSLANLARLKYLARLGNTPGHVQQWRRRPFIDLVSRYFDLELLECPFPWTMVRGGKKWRTK